MQNYMKTIISAIQTWVKSLVKGSVADWNQNDSNADNYIKNRTHYEEDKTIIHVENLTREMYRNEEIETPKCTFVEGNTYNVLWNDTWYKGLVCYLEDGYHVIASNSLGCPFYIDDDGGNSLYIESDSDGELWTVSIYEYKAIVHKLDKKYLPDEIGNSFNDLYNEMNHFQEQTDTLQTDIGTLQTDKMDKNNPTGTGSFSMNRKSGTLIGEYSSANGHDTIASSNYSSAIGCNTVSGGRSRFVSGEYNANTQVYYDMYSEFVNTNSLFSKTGTFYHSDEYTFDPESGLFTLISPVSISASAINNNYINTLLGKYFVANNSGDLIDGAISGNKLVGVVYQHEIGSSIYTSKISSYNNAFNEIQYISRHQPWESTTDRGIYVHIVGNGAAEDARSNAHTLAWDGTAWYQGDVYVGSTSGTNRDEGSKKLATEDYVAEFALTEEKAKKIVYNCIYLADTENNHVYKLEIKNGTLTTSLDTERFLQDFTYTTSEDGTHTITGWKETLNGESSTELIVPEITMMDIEI